MTGANDLAVLPPMQVIAQRRIPVRRRGLASREVGERSNPGQNAICVTATNTGYGICR